MKQAVVPEPGKIIYQDVDRPTLEANQVLIRIARIGICGSDVHVFKGKHPLVSFPLVQGHEFSGYVEETGSQVSGFAKGDLVTVEPAIACGECERCQQGLVAQCEKMLFIGGALPGAGSEFLAVAADYVVKMPEGVSAEDAAMTEPLAVAVHSVRRAHTVEGKRVLVVGGGTIGNLTAQVARLYGAKEVVVLDKLPFRNQLAEQLGFQTINPAMVISVVDEIVKRLGGHPEVAFECVGSAAPLNTCIRSVVRGGDVVVIGVYEEPPTTDMVLVQDKEINMLGSLMYTWDDFHTTVAIIAQKQVALEPLRTHYLPFEEWLEGYNLLINSPNEAMKVMLNLI